MDIIISRDSRRKTIVLLANCQIILNHYCDEITVKSDMFSGKYYFH